MIMLYAMKRKISYRGKSCVKPPGYSKVGVQDGVFTSAEDLNDVTLGWVFFDLRPKFEADLMQMLKLAP